MGVARSIIRQVATSVGLGLGSTRGGGGVTLEEFQVLFSEAVDPKITGNDSTFDGAGNWAVGLGSLSASDINNTVEGAMYLNFVSGNQAVKLNDTVNLTGYFLVRIKAKKVSGTGMPIRIGSFTSGAPNENEFDITPVTSSRWYYGYLYNFGTTTFYIGALDGINNGTKIAIEEVRCEQVTVAEIAALNYNSLPRLNFENLYTGVNRSSQTLLKIGVVGDSIMANSYGGAIPVADDEGDTLRPPRITTNNVPRRVYDLLKYNAPNFRRLDHADWTRSTLSGGDDFAELIDSDDTPWFPNNTSEKYFRTAQSGAYCEIIIPDGFENCAFVYRKTYQYNLNNFDSAVGVTINGGDISAYGDSSIDETLNAPTYQDAVRGYGLNLAEYSGLPTGNNTIRLTKSADTTEFQLWGVLYWSGNSVVLLNNAFGGAPITALDDHVFQHTIVNSFDLGFTQMPIMNNCSEPVTLINQLVYLCEMLNCTSYPISNTLFFASHPFGTDPRDNDPNYYTLYADPNFKESTELAMKVMGYFGLNYIDVFKYFESDLLSRGGTLIGGEAGTYYTTDGQHPSEDGADKYDEYLTDRLPVIPD